MNKKGNAYIFMIVIIVLMFIILFTAVFLLYIQLNSQVYSVKQDMFYIVQNSIFAMNKNKLSLFEYEIDEVAITGIISRVVLENAYPFEIKILSLNYNKEMNKVNLSYSVSINPIILSSKIGKINYILNDSIKLKMMEVN